eukprot:TRINITY_DN2467_c2_g1_i2.p1 TRINITY_DN2467_c2_g1~~TRINITY_DN2467_c2_g1_i2.p1  ORF type:complete len:137 (+),score=39.06 TRINITY_DN2467_c2_g1_i2:261-671(+)
MKMTKNVGTQSYLAPEVLENGSYSIYTDVYSFAVLAYIVLVENDPFASFKTAWEITDYVVRGDRPKIPEEVPSQLAFVISRCWAQTAHERPNFYEITQIMENIVLEEKRKVDGMSMTQTTASLLDFEEDDAASSKS